VDVAKAGNFALKQSIVAKEQNVQLAPGAGEEALRLTRNRTSELVSTS
jgi:hypothetical protein